MFSHIKELFTTPSGYNIAKSVRLRSSASAYFNRTLGSGSTTAWTWSGWVKRGYLGANQTTLFFGDSSGTNYGGVYFTADALYLLNRPAAGVNAQLTTTQVFRDPSAWYHIIAVWDTANATSVDRLRLYVNGVRITAFSTATYPAQNTASVINTAIAHELGSTQAAGVGNYFDGYLTEINFIDGQALTPSSFGTTNATTGVWQPAKYTGTYGTNGFYLNFSDNSNNTATTIGKDYSGNGNNWTPNNISVTSGVTYDSMVDSPTVSAVSSNYAVLNPLVNSSYQNITQGNLATFSNTSTDSGIAVSTIGVSTGKFYWEVTISGGSSGYPITGALRNIPASGNGTITGSSTTGGFGYYTNIGYVIREGTTLSTTVATCTTGDVVGFALDIDNLQVLIYKNNSLIYTVTGLTAGTYFPSTATYASTGVYANFGQRPFSYTPPTGYVALNTYNLPASTITNGAAYMAATLYTGNGTSQNINNSVNGVSFAPDLVWFKSRSSGALWNVLCDTIRGATKELYSNATNAETTDVTDLTAFTSNGFSVGSGNGANQSAGSYVGWQWKAGGTSSSNTNGSITSTVSVGATQGFSVVTYTGTGANATVGHGLGVAPQMVIVKQRNGVATYWCVYHTSLASGYAIYLNATFAAGSDAPTFNSTAPTSSVFSVGTSTATNTNGNTYVAYCFAAVKGFSAFGSYTGNGSSDGPFTYLGFRPRWVMWKLSSTTGDWQIWDSSRNTYNIVGNLLDANLSNSEFTSQSAVDFLSNGFKNRSASVGNDSGQTYIYAAFAENPFRNALAR